MKKLRKISLISILTMAMVACGGGSDDLTAKKEQLQNKKSELAKLKAEISTLEKEIQQDDPEFNKKAEVLVASIPVKSKTFVHRIEVRGSVESKKNVIISAETMGRVEKIHVEEGDYVKTGEALIELDADIIRNNISEVETQLELATTVFERQENLWKQKIGTEIQYLQAKNNMESLEKRLNTLRSQMAQYYVKAPFSGTVDNVAVKVGEIAQPGVPLIRIINPREMYIKADVSEAYLGKIKPGDQVEVYFPIQERTFSSQIKSVSKVINSENRTFRVEINLPETSDFEFQPNQVVVTKMTDYENENAIAIPTKLVQTDDEGKFVYVVNNTENQHKASKVRVKTGYNFNSETEILAGLKGGEMLIEKGYRDVNDGVEVKLAQR